MKKTLLLLAMLPLSGCLNLFAPPEPCEEERTLEETGLEQGVRVRMLDFLSGCFEDSVEFWVDLGDTFSPEDIRDQASTMPDRTVASVEGEVIEALPVGRHLVCYDDLNSGVTCALFDVGAGELVTLTLSTDDAGRAFNEAGTVDAIQL